MRAILMALVIFAIVITHAGEAVPSAALCRVLGLRIGANSGSGFTLEVDGRQYIVTAKHLLPGTNVVEGVEVFYTSGWTNYPMSVMRSSEADVAVLVAPKLLTPPTNVVLGGDGAFLGQEVYFLGFPYMLHNDVPAELNNGLPIPFVKKGALSAWIKGGAKYSTIYVDGINNPGFSGGPLIGAKLGSKETMILGVVSGYRVTADSVVNNNLDTGLKSVGNTGIIICYDVQYAVDEIKKQAGGPVVR